MIRDKMGDRLERKREASKKYYLKNKDKVLQRTKEHYEKHKEEIRSKRREAYHLKKNEVCESDCEQ